MWESSLYDYSDAYVLVKGTIAITVKGGETSQQDKETKDIKK